MSCVTESRDWSEAIQFNFPISYIDSIPQFRNDAICLYLVQLWQHQPLSKAIDYFILNSYSQRNHIVDFAPIAIKCGMFVTNSYSQRHYVVEFGDFSYEMRHVCHARTVSTVTSLFEDTVLPKII